MVMFAVFTGAFSFAMLAASWLIRERRRLEREHQVLQLENADLRSRHERAQALLDVPDQRVVIWSSAEEYPICRGTLPLTSGAPDHDAAFIDFNSWMAAKSARSFARAVQRLRDRAEGFDLTIEAQNGAMIEVQGRASGSHAFVRFLNLAGDRAALASLESEYTMLLQTTDRMKALLEQAPMPVWLRDEDQKLAWANSAYVQAVDASSVEEVCHNNIELIDAAKREEMAEALSSPKSSGSNGPNRFQQRFPATISGDRRLMDVSEVAYSGGSAGLAVDMSELEEVQSGLSRTVESHARTMDQLASAIAIFDNKQHLKFYNRAFREMWDLKQSALDGEPENGALFDLLRAEGKLAEQQDWSVWRNGQLEIYEKTGPNEDWWYLPDGRSLRVVANPHKQGGVTWVFENITEKLEMESRLAALTKVQGETLDCLSEAIAVFSADGRLKLSNPSFQSMWQLSDEQVAADTALSAIADHCSAVSEGSHWRNLVTAVTGVAEERTSLSGRIHASKNAIVDYAMMPLPNGQNMISFVDVTANVQMAQALTERNEALEAAEKLKNAFIEHVSYEFRTPLTNIIGFADLLQQQVFGGLNDKQLEYVGDITSSSKVLHSLVDNMLDLATLDAGILELNLETVDVAGTVQAAVKSVSERLKEQGIRLRMKLPQKNERFVVDAVRVQQILYNLLTNAIRFSPTDSEIVVETTTDRDAISLRISDSGPGIPEDKRATIFQRFESQARGGAGRGAGLGLAIARSLVELHGGTIELDGGVDKGASFILRIPRQPRAQAQAAE